MTASMEDAEAIAAVDAILMQGGLRPGRRSSQMAGAAVQKQARRPREDAAAQASARLRPGIVKVEEWARFSWLRAGFSTRQGGGSTAYRDPEISSAGEQNLGWTADDSPDIVAESRRRFVRAITGAVSAKAAMQLVTIRQFHSGMGRVVEREKGALATAGGKAVLRGDALLTRRPGLLLGIQTADCVPVLLADTRTRAVAAFHAGWRGTLARIVERGVGAMRLEFGSQPEDMVAAIGPAIGACCFAVGEEVRFEFESQFAYAPELFSEVYDSDPVRQKYPMLFLTARAPGHSNLGPQIHLDLREANRRQLLDAGLRASAISLAGECTACARRRDGRRKYFSHRAERGLTGRMLSVIGVVP